MTDPQRCEPPEHLRGVDGWHWVETQAGQIRFCRRWWKARGEWCWANMDDRTLRGFRYLAPAAPPDVVRALVEALEECANDLEAHVMREYSGDVLTVGNTLRRARDLDPVDAARAALARAKEAGL